MFCQLNYFEQKMSDLDQFIIVLYQYCLQHAVMFHVVLMR